MADLLSETGNAATVALKQNSDLAGIASRIYNVEAPATPTWPWVLVGNPTENARIESGYDVASMSLTVHGFVKPDITINPRPMVYPATAAIANSIKRALDGKVIYRGGVELHFTHEQTQIIRDSAEVSAYHEIVRFAVGVNGEVQ